MNRNKLKAKMVPAATMLGILVLNPIMTANAQSMNYGALEDLFGEPVTTSATGKPQRSSEVPATMEIISAEEIARWGMRSLPDLLNRVVGVETLSWGAASADVGLRGYGQASNPRLLVLINGRQVYLDFYGTAIWSAIPVELSEIRQIEVVKGPQAAMFGFNAVSGVINIITYNPLYDSVGAAQATVGTQDYRDISLVKSFKLFDNFGARLSAGARDVDEFGTASRDQFIRQIRQNTNVRRSVSLDTLGQLTPNIQAGFEATWNRSDQVGLGALQEIQQGIFEVRSLKASLKAQTGIGLIDATAYQNKLDFSLRFQANGRNSNITTSTDTKVFQVNNLVKIVPNLTTRIGLEYRDNMIDSYPVAAAKTGYKNYAFSNMYDWTISDDLSLTVAGRIDRTALQRDGFRPYPYTAEDYERKFDSYSFNSGMVWRASPIDTVKLTAGRGNQSSSLIELNNNVIAVPSTTALLNVGNPYLNPTVVTNYEVGYERAIEEIGGSAKLSVFRQISEDFKVINISAPTLVRGYRVLSLGNNYGTSRLWGAEAELSGQVDAYRWSVSWNWLSTDDNFTFARGTTGIDFDNSTPKHTIKGNLGYTSGKWNADLFMIWRSSFDQYLRSQALYLVHVGAGATAQAAVTYNVSDSFAVTLSGSNLFQEETQLSSAPKAERRFFATATYKF